MTEDELTESDRARLIRQVGRLRLAAHDMAEASLAAQHLEHYARSMNEYAERALYAGMVVCYLRPFTRSNIGQLDADDWIEPSDRKVHDDLKTERDKVYAHTDVTDMRRVTARDAGAAGVRYVEDRAPFNPDALPVVADLAERLRVRFEREADLIERRLQPEP